MNSLGRMFYLKLAIMNLKKNSSIYLPYILTSIGTIAMFFIIHGIATSDEIEHVTFGPYLQMMMFFGVVVIGIFATIFLFYTNSFLMKRRKKEIGLYHIMGLDKGHIAKVMFWETLLTSMISLGAGVITGMALSRLVVLVLLKIVAFESPFSFYFSLESIGFTALIFFGIFLLTMVYNLWGIYRSNPIEILNQDRVGEKEPKSRWVLAILGVIILGIGYAIAWLVNSAMWAVLLFLLAATFVIIGTYLLFIAGSVTFLKQLKKNKKYYYNTKHFVSVSGMLYRMKQNAVGLANICILSTMALVCIVPAASLYFNMDELLNSRTPYDISINVKDFRGDSKDRNDVIRKTVKSVEEEEIQITKAIDYEYLDFWVSQQDNELSYEADYNSFDMNMATVNILTLSDYNRINRSNAVLDDGQVLLFDFYNKNNLETIKINGLEYEIKEYLKQMPIENSLYKLSSGGYIIIVKDLATMAEINNVTPNTSPILNVSLNITGTDEAKISCQTRINQSLKPEYNFSSDCRAEMKSSFYELYGVFLFLGSFLGLLFIMATVLIIYYKQISEGYDDQKRFEIMQKVGMSSDEVKTAIKSQVQKVFFIPLICSFIHLLLSFKIVSLLLSALNFNNPPLYFICLSISCLIFTLIYLAIYAITARTYYKLVKI